MNFKKSYDKNACKHFLEDIHFVLHCHHYNSLMHRAITKTPYLDGKKFIFNISAQEFYKALKHVCSNQRATSSSEIIKIAEALYKALGFGDLKMSNLSNSGGRVQSPTSHLSTGYLNKWGKQEEPVDDFGRAYVAASWALAFGHEVKSCKVEQIKCISCGDSICEFEIRN